MKRQQQPNKLQLNKKRRSERDVTLSSSSLQSEAQPGTSSNSSGASYQRRPPLPPSRIATVEQASENAASAKPRDEKSLLEKLVAEMEEKRKDHHHGGIMKWTPLPPPNLELYLRKPVVLLEWDDNMTSNSELDLTDNRPTNDADVDSIADDISELTVRLEDVEKELSFLSSQDKDHSGEIVENQGGAITKGGSDLIPPAPDFTDDGDDDDYGSGSDMDLFGDEDYNRLYDNIDHQLQQGQDTTSKEDQRKSVSSVDFSLPALVEVGHQQSSTPTSTAIPPHSRESSTDSHGDDVIMKELIFQQHQGSQQGESKPPLDPRRGGGGSPVGSRSRLHQTMVERTLETIRQFTDSVPPEQQPAPRGRSSSSEYKLSSPDSDDPPPVNWGRGSRQVASAASISSASAVSTSAGTSYSMHTIKNEQPRAHCSKDILQSSSSTSYQPCPLVAEKCPICNFSFPLGYTQLEVDEHVAVCLSAMDWEDQDEGAADF